jgi:cell shape-determining protein MreC
MKLALKLTILFLLLAIVLTAIVGYLAYENSRRTIVKETINHLVSITLFKSNELKRWVEDNKGGRTDEGRQKLKSSIVLAKRSSIVLR